MKLAVTGHRPAKLGGESDNPIRAYIKQAIDEVLIRFQPEVVITGLAMGVDQWTADICAHNDIPYIVALPCDGVATDWLPIDKAEFHRLLRQARSVHVEEAGGLASDPALINRRNRWIMRNCDTLLAIWDGSPGGTRSMIELASEFRREIIQPPIPQAIWEQARAISDAINSSRVFRPSRDGPSQHPGVPLPAPPPVAAPVLPRLTRDRFVRGVDLLTPNHMLGPDGRPLPPPTVDPDVEGLTAVLEQVREQRASRDRFQRDADEQRRRARQRQQEEEREALRARRRGRSASADLVRETFEEALESTDNPELVKQIEEMQRQVLSSLGLPRDVVSGTKTGKKGAQPPDEQSSTKPTRVIEIDFGDE
jgi:uncharacterized phage-like protein YoqJ